MRHFITAFFTALFFAARAAMATENPETEAAKDELWAAITNTDYAAAEAIIANAHAEYLQNGTNQNRTRDLLGLFYANNPMLDRFAEGWLDTYPNSPFAHTAHAWLLHKRSWDIRGPGPAREIYPLANALFRRMQFEGLDDAQAAYSLDNRLLPASDAVLRLAVSTGAFETAYEVLHEVMKNDPNMGTLRRAIGMTAPGWGPGGTWEAAVQLCEFYGPMITNHDTDPVEYCKIFAAGEYHPDKERRDWLFNAVTSGDYPEFEHFVLPRYTHNNATRAEAEFARAYLNRTDVTEPRHAENFDMNVANRYGFDFVQHIHQLRARDHALEAIKRDPYNPALLKTLLRGVSRMSREDDILRSTMIVKPTHDEHLEYTRRMLVAAPYDPENWQAYGSTKIPQTPENLLKDDPIQVNTVVYSDHEPRYVLGYAIDKWQLLASLERIEHEPQSEAFQRLSPERQKRARGEIQKWIAARENINLDEDIRCPMMRAYRLYKLLCETSRSIDCSIDPRQQEMFEIVRADITKRRVCTGVMSVPAHELFFTPIPVDLSAPEG